MAEQAALTATVRARLDEFERDMRKAEDIISNAIDKMERDLGVKLDLGKRMEESLNQAQPRLRAATVAIGNLISQGITAGLALAQKALEDFVEQFKRMKSAAELTGLSMERIATITSAIGTKDVPAALERVATLLDRARRGEENALVKLLAENKQSVASVRDAADAWDRVAKIIANAFNRIQAREIAKSLGISEEVADNLFRMGDAYTQIVEQSADAGRRMQEIADKAAQFDQAWDQAAKNFKAAMVDSVESVTRSFARLVEFMAEFLNFISAPGIGTSLGKFLGVEAVSESVTVLRELAASMREVSLASSEMARQAGIGDIGRRLTGGERGTRLGRGGAGFARPIDIATRERGGGAEGRDPFERELDRIRKSIALHQAEADTIGQTAEARERARTVAVLEEAAIRANTAAGLENTAVTAQQRDQINQMADAMEQVVRKRAAMQAIASEMRNLAGLLSGAIEEMVFQGKKLDEVLRNIAQRLASRAMQQALERLLVTLGSSLFSSSGLGGVLGGTFNPVGGFGRQAGGHVIGGRSYLVGERGPELFVPTQSGQVIPNHALGGAGGVVINQTYDARGADPMAIRRLELIIAEDRRALPGRVLASINDAKRRSAGR